MSIILSSFRARLQAAEREYMIEALRVADGSITAVASLTGLHKTVVHAIMVRHDLLHLQKKCAEPWRLALAARRKSFGNAAWRALADV